MFDSDQNSIFQSDFCQRLVVHSILLIFLVILLCTSLYPSSAFIVGLLSSSCAAIGTYEMASMTRMKFPFSFTRYSAMGSAIFIALTCLTTRCKMLLPNHVDLIPWFFLFLWTIRLIFKSRYYKLGPIGSTGLALFCMLYVSVPIRLFIHILYGFVHTDTPFIGIWWAIFLIATTKSSDIFGYFFGKAFGKRRIAPVISPNKTVIGFIAGCMGSILVSLLFYSHLPKAFADQIAMPWILVALGVVLGISGFFGDIIESIFKRDAQIKNSSDLESIGGMLDVLDSLLLATPIVYAILLITQHGIFLG
ncbi:phosphatidate cytidylyltransferase [Chlamydia sp.]|uniref:phosphatidate cytidylyltransferase n=1 Tax=Chlamydia sp. TaxID=35827 RepID=UPI0025BBF693|nr:phosphatidate cytidylyltransferase [Chlamydia sp.]MBQ8498649.1 phosphatidate cytidylyltransferase [Chlamydia sp.]